MRSASFIMEAPQKQAAFISDCLNNVLQLCDWKHIISYEVRDDAQTQVAKSIGEIREAWWPVARRLLFDAGQLPLGELLELRKSIETLNNDFTGILGKDKIAQLYDPVDVYFVTGRLPLEWIFLRDYPLCLYAPFYRFSRPQDMASMYAPKQEASKLVIAPSYSKPNLTGIDDAAVETARHVRNRQGIELLAGEVGIDCLQHFQNRQFGGVLFQGHATAEGLLASDGTAIPYDAVLKLVQGPAFLLGCATGAIETGTLFEVSRQIPNGLHGALLTAFPTSVDYIKKITSIVMGTFLSGDARRVQDIAHMSRLSLAWLGIPHAILRLANRHSQMRQIEIVTPFEMSGAYDAKYDRWGAGVEELRQQMTEKMTGVQGKDLNELVLPIVTAFAMAIVSCGTPAFLLPSADPRTVTWWKAFAHWDGKT